jgi:gluconate 5-dehydrogenase
MAEPIPHLPAFRLDGRVALVSGASRGIGRALALGLAEAGADVALAARSKAALDEVAGEIAALGRRPLALALDVAQVAELPAAVGEVVQALGGLDILDNNAGIEQVADSLAADEALWERIQGTNLKAAFFLSQAAARAMGKRGGAILSVCSLTSAVGVPTAVAYTSSKSGLLGMTRALAAEWALRGIRVNALGGLSPHRADRGLLSRRDLAGGDAWKDPGRPLRPPRRPAGRRGVPVLGRRGLRDRPDPLRRRRLPRLDLRSPMPAQAAEGTPGRD